MHIHLDVAAEIGKLALMVGIIAIAAALLMALWEHKGNMSRFNELKDKLDLGTITEDEMKELMEILRG